MTHDISKPSLRSRLRWWLYKTCFAYCVRCVDPSADPDEFMLLDIVNFSAVSKDEIQQLIEEAPEIAWHFKPECEF